MDIEVAQQQISSCFSASTVSGSESTRLMKTKSVIMDITYDEVNVGDAGGSHEVDHDSSESAASNGGQTLKDAHSLSSPTVLHLIGISQTCTEHKIGRVHETPKSNNARRASQTATVPVLPSWTGSISVITNSKSRIRTRSFEENLNIPVPGAG